MTQQLSRIEQMVSTQRVIVMIGSGGVGKTTSSVAIAIASAMQGKRVALLSIDPAKRLADALGIPLGHELAQVKFPDSYGITGTLKAAMLDQKAVFDSMVQRHAPSEHIADRILRDPLYIAASTNLSGPLEYMALARLQELADDPNIDVVVLDTPPDTHALDFLGRPNVLAGFLEGKVISKLLRPMVLAGKFGFSSIAVIGEKLLGGVSSLTGFTAFRKFGEFILLMQEVIEGFHASGERVLEILRRPSSSFVLVALPTQASTRSGEHLVSQLNQMGYALDGVIFNRCLPAGVENDEEKLHETERMIFKTRRAGEASCLAQMSQRVKSTPRNVDLWILHVDEKPKDLCSVEAVVQLARELSRV